MQSRISYFIFFIFLLLNGCFSNNDNSVRRNEIIQEESSSSLNKFWNKYHFTSNEVKHYPDMIEQSLVDYISQFPNYSIDEVSQSLSFLINKSEQDSSFFFFLRGKISDYLSHPNSPMRNDFYFEHVLKNYQRSSLLSDSDKIRDRILLDLVNKNQVGHQAANFKFEDVNGIIKNLSDFNTSNLLLVFYDPNCTHCSEVITEMKGSFNLNKAIESNKIVVLAIDPLGNYDNWKKYHKNIPINWINGFDNFQFISKESIYNIQAYPTIYLISFDGKVLLKDVYFSEIEKYLLNND